MPGAGYGAQGLNSSPGHDTGQALRDLRWLLLSPPLLARGRFTAEVQAFGPEERRAIERWLDALQADSGRLQQALEYHRAAPLRLGRYAERLLEFFLRAGPTHHLVAANLPLRKPASNRSPGPTTLGEIDFLLEDASGRPWHWELAVKFFLCVAPGPQARVEDFIGPDPADTLADKLKSLFERQLVRKPPAPWHERLWRPAAFTRGWMFYPFEHDAAGCDALSPGHSRGHWLALSQVDRLPQGSFLVPPRARWMSPVQASTSEALLAASDLSNEIRRLWTQASPRPLTPRLVARMEPGAEGRWHETQRYFVVPDGWPST